MSTLAHPEVQTQKDFLPLNGTDYVEFYVGNARQASYYYRLAFGMKLVAYAGPETGVRNRASYVLEQGKKGLIIQRYKGLGEMTAPQLWDTTMDPERRTLLSVKLEDIAECETIFTTLMGEDVEARRKFIEENALDVKNLDI